MKLENTYTGILSLTKSWAKAATLTGLLLLVSVINAYAQETSRQIPFSNVQTTLPARSTNLLTVQLQDAAGTVLFSEQSNIAVDNKNRVSFFFGASTAAGLDPAHFPSGSSRFIDVVDGTGATVLVEGRIALMATPFSLSPGPQGPEGPAGPQGPAGPAVNITAADGSIAIGGTSSEKTIAVATNGINNLKIADGALSPTKITGTAATLGTNLFTGNQNVNGAISTTGPINTASQYNIGGNRVLSIPGAFNMIAGIAAGQDIAAGSNNSFFGNSAGQKTSSGSNNAFFGMTAGQSNTTGSNNSFFGNTSGLHTTTANDNSFFGAAAGLSNTAGKENSFFGSSAGLLNQTGNGNAFFGHDAGRNNESTFNAFFGARAGKHNTTGFNNSFFGESAGLNNTTGRNNAFLGHIAGLSNTTGERNSAVGSFSAERNSTGSRNSFFGFFAGRFNTTGDFNSFFGDDAGRSNTAESLNTFIGAGSNGVPGITNATALGADAVVGQSNSVVLGNNASVGVGTSAPKAKLHVQGGHVFVGSPGQGIILKSPNGLVCRLWAVNDNGVFGTFVVACPN